MEQQLILQKILETVTDLKNTVGPLKEDVSSLIESVEFLKDHAVARDEMNKQFGDIHVCFADLKSEKNTPSISNGVFLVELSTIQSS